MRPEQGVALALEVAEEGMRQGEMPIGAVVLRGEEVVASAFTQEQALGRRVVHADLLAILAADTVLGPARSALPLTLAVNLEPCLMCLGAAITLGVETVWYGLDSPDDGAVDLLRHWRPPVEQPFFRRPSVIVGGLLREQVKAQFGRYAAAEGQPVGMRAWALGLARS